MHERVDGRTRAGAGTRHPGRVALALCVAASVGACAHGAGVRPEGANADERTAASTDTVRTYSQSATRVEELFAGRFPGVQAYPANGGMVVRVRGQSSLSSVSPLFVIDGQPVNVGSDGLVSINPSDVSRIEVVKDAAELALFGSRGGNGVVKITTKRPGRR